MDKKIKAQELRAQFGHDAKYVVYEIIEALKITTGHCTLNNLDWEEVRSDLMYWRGVEDEIEQLPRIKDKEECPDCNDRGWLYDENGIRTGTCPCHLL